MYIQKRSCDIEILSTFTCNVCFLFNVLNYIILYIIFKPISITYIRYINCYQKSSLFTTSC